MECRNRNKFRRSARSSSMLLGNFSWLHRLRHVYSQSLRCTDHSVLFLLMIQMKTAPTAQDGPSEVQSYQSRKSLRDATLRAARTMHDHVGRTTIQKRIVTPPSGRVTMQHVKCVCVCVYVTNGEQSTAVHTEYSVQ